MSEVYKYVIDPGEIYIPEKHIEINHIYTHTVYKPTYKTKCKSNFNLCKLNATRSLIAIRFTNIKNIFQGSGGGSGVKHLPCKCADQSWGHQELHINHVSVMAAAERWGQGIPRASWLARLAEPT